MIILAKKTLKVSYQSSNTINIKKLMVKTFLKLYMSIYYNSITFNFLVRMKNNSLIEFNIRYSVHLQSAN